MSEKLYRAIRREDYKEEPVQYAAVYVTKWDDSKMGEPSMLFVEVEESEQQPFSKENQQEE